MKTRKVFQKGEKRKQRRIRMTFLVFFFLVGFSVLVGRSLQLHLSRDLKLEKRASTQYAAKINEVPLRGTIYDASGEELAVSVPTYSLAAWPRKIADVSLMSKTLSEILGVPASTISKQLDTEKKYVWIKKSLSPQEAEKISALSIEGTDLVKEPKRFYPNREVASQILGAVNSENKGLGGLELFYDRYLRGTASAAFSEEKAYRDARGKTFRTEKSGEEPERSIHHLTLTLRKNIQYVTETELSEACSSSRAKACTAIVMEPQTGAILAMSSYPTFNPNAYGDSSLDHWRNRAITDAYEPGSTFKAILAASALESGLVRTQDKFFCENGALAIGKYTIHDHEKYGSLSLRDILKVSSNIGIYKVGRKVGRKGFADVIRLLGFGQKTGIDYPGEIPGLVPSHSQWPEIQFATISFGQGILVTPLQIATGFAILANGGHKIHPHFVSRVTDFEGRTVLEAPTTPGETLLKKETTEGMIEMLKEVTTEGGTATKAALPGYTVAGKTGTAQKVVGKRYSHTQFVSSFVGMVPASDPKLVIFVSIDEPQGVIYGGLVAAPVFQKIARSALRDLGIPPDKPSENKTPAVEVASPSSEGVDSLGMASQKLPTRSWGEEKKDGNLLEAGFLGGLGSNASGDSESSFPDFRGLSRRRVLATLETLKLHCATEGSGIAVSQDPSPGAPFESMKKERSCRIFFKAE